jgi:hypothetical protein
MPTAPDPDVVHIHATMEGLCRLPGPSGLEGQVRDHVERSWREHGVEVRRDPVGKLLGRVGGSGPRVLLQATRSSTSTGSSSTSASSRGRRPRRPGSTSARR